MPVSMGMNWRRHLLEALTLIVAAVLCAGVANALAGRERKLALKGNYPNALRVPAPPAPAPPVMAAPVTVTTATVTPTTTNAAPILPPPAPPTPTTTRPPVPTP